MSDNDDPTLEDDVGDDDATADTGEQDEAGDAGEQGEAGDEENEDADPKPDGADADADPRDADAAPATPVDVPLKAHDLQAGLGGLARVGTGLDYAFTVLNVAKKCAVPRGA